MTECPDCGEEYKDCICDDKIIIDVPDDFHDYYESQREIYERERKEKMKKLGTI